MNEMRADLIAPCGINCRLCLAYQRIRNHCIGCRIQSAEQPEHCKKCVMKNCADLHNSGSEFCGACEKYPCRRLKQLDKRYRAKYHTSVLENLDAIRSSGMEQFLHQEEVRWKCPNCGAILCMHRNVCPSCHFIYTE